MKIEKIIECFNRNGINSIFEDENSFLINDSNVLLDGDLMHYGESDLVSVRVNGEIPELYLNKLKLLNEDISKINATLIIYDQELNFPLPFGDYIKNDK
jgi:hypothetical protein